MSAEAEAKGRRGRGDPTRRSSQSPLPPPASPPAPNISPTSSSSSTVRPHERRRKAMWCNRLHLISLIRRGKKDGISLRLRVESKGCGRWNRSPPFYIWRQEVCGGTSGAPVRCGALSVVAYGMCVAGVNVDMRQHQNIYSFCRRRTSMWLLKRLCFETVAQIIMVHSACGWLQQTNSLWNMISEALFCFCSFRCCLLFFFFN